MGEERPFRNSVFGGFNRKDVIDYIEELLSRIEADKSLIEEKDKRIAELEQEAKAREVAGVTASPITAPVTASPIIVDSDDPDEVLSQVDRILKNYLGEEE